MHSGEYGEYSICLLYCARSQRQNLACTFSLSAAQAHLDWRDNHDDPQTYGMLISRQPGQVKPPAPENLRHEWRRGGRKNGGAVTQQLQLK